MKFTFHDGTKDDSQLQWWLKHRYVGAGKCVAIYTSRAEIMLRNRKDVQHGCLSDGRLVIVEKVSTPDSPFAVALIVERKKVIHDGMIHSSVWWEYHYGHKRKSNPLVSEAPRIVR